MLTRVTFTHPHPQAGASTPAHLVISLHGEEDTERARPDVAVIPVVDVSGSMGSQSKLHLVTTALAHLSEHLAGTDRLALVAFDSAASTPVPLMRADAEGVGMFSRALTRLRPGSATALSEGIRAGLAQAARTPADVVTRVVVLTDGGANVGDTDLDTLVSLVRARPEHVSISFLGVGRDCDHDLLGELAEHGGGSYGFIETATDAPAALGNEIGGLLDAEAHQVTVTVTTRNRYCTLAADAPLGMVGERDEDELRVSLAQVLRGATRNIIVPVTLHGAGRNHARPVTCADVVVTATIGDDDIEVSHRPKVKYQPEAGPVDEDLVEKVELAQVAQSIANARTLARSGDFAGARAMVAGTQVVSSTASLLRDSLSDVYASSASYNTASGDLSAAVAATSGSLVGSSLSFAALADATIGNTYTSGQRRVAAATSQQSLGRNTATGPAAPPRTPGTDADAGDDHDDAYGDAGSFLNAHARTRANSAVTPVNVTGDLSASWGPTILGSGAAPGYPVFSASLSSGMTLNLDNTAAGASSAPTAQEASPTHTTDDGGTDGATDEADDVDQNEVPA